MKNGDSGILLPDGRPAGESTADDLVGELKKRQGIESDRNVLLTIIEARLASIDEALRLRVVAEVRAEHRRSYTAARNGQLDDIFAERYAESLRQLLHQAGGYQEEPPEAEAKPNGNVK